MWCGTCRAALPSQAKFCHHCGTPTYSLSRAAASQRTSGAQKIVVLVCAGVALVTWSHLQSIALALFGVLLLTICFGWNSARFSQRDKALGLAVVLILIVAAQVGQSKYVERGKAKEVEAKEQQNRLAKEQDIERERKFRLLSSHEHLLFGKKLLTSDVSPPDRLLAFKHLDAVATNDLSEAKAIRSRFLAAEARAKEAADRASSLRAEQDAKVQASLDEALRISMAKVIENRMLDKGLNVDVTTLGSRHTTIKLKYIFVSKVFAHQLSQNGELFEELKKAGFKKLIASDGYDEQWTWDL